MNAPQAVGEKHSHCRGLELCLTDEVNRRYNGIEVLDLRFNYLDF